MADPEEKGVLIEPVRLDPAAGQEKKAPKRMGLGLLLVVLLAGWTWMLSMWMQGSPEDQPITPDAVGTTPEVVETEVSPEIPPAATATPEPPPVLTLTSDPPGASVLMSGLFRGVTPLEVEAWTEGDPVEFRLTGYAPVRKSAPDHQTSATLTAVLTVEVAPVRFSGDVEGTVLQVEGRVMQLPESGVVNLPLQETTVRFEKPGFEPWQRTVTPTQAYQREVRVTLTPRAVRESTDAPAVPKASTDPVVRNSVGMDMVLMSVPMEGPIGAARGTPGRKSQEAIRKVRLERAFRLSATEVSNRQFAQFDARHSSGTAGPIQLSAGDLPVVNVRWEQAVQFCNWLSQQEGLPPAYAEKDGRWYFEAQPGTGYRLPTEAEWEMVMRVHAGGALYPWGDRMPPPANTVQVAGKESLGVVSTVLKEYEDSSRGPVSVEKAFPGPAPILGLGGNVREWVHDGFSAPAPGQDVAVDPMGESAARFHVMKGAGWRDGRWMDLRIAKRAYGDQPADDLGFRIARYVNP